MRGVRRWANIACLLALLLPGPRMAGASEGRQVVGTWPDGKPRVLAVQQDGRRVREEHLAPDGRKTAEALWRDTRRADWCRYHASGSKAATWTEVDGKKQGDEVHFDEAGKRVRVVPYRDGLRHGIVTEYLPDGVKTSEIRYEKGDTASPLQTYHPTGERRSVVPLVEERKHGVETLYDTQGHKTAELSWRFGKQDGPARTFDVEGRLASVVTYRDDRPVGEETQFHPSGGRRLVIPLEEGERHGTASVYAEDGRKIAELPFVHGRVHGMEKRFDEAGRHVLDVEHRDGVQCCTVTSYYPSGARQSQRTFTDEKENGKEVRWFDQGPDGAPGGTQMEVPIAGGRKHGLAVVYAPTGEKFSEVWFVDDRRDGPEVRFYPKTDKEPGGEKMAEFRWQNDRFIGNARTFWRNGKLQSEFPFTDGAGTGLERRWDEAGRLRFEVPLVLGKKEGVAKVYDEKGKIVATLSYAGDVQHGEEQRLRGGKVVATYTWERGELLGGTGLAVKRPGPSELPDVVTPSDVADADKPARGKEPRRPSGPPVERKGGLMRTYYPDGQLQSVYPASGNGTETQYHPSGKERMIAPLVGGKRHGIARIYDETGVLWATTPWVRGKQSGVQVRYARTGEKLAEYPYENGKPTGIARTWYPDGSKESEYNFDPKLAKGTEILFHRNGETRMYAPLQYGKRHGVATLFSESGSKWADVPYQNGLKHGTERRYDQAGQVVKEVYWERGREVGRPGEP